MEKQIGKFMVVRHTHSEWNDQGLWTGYVDVGLSPDGFERAHRLGETIKDLKIDYVFCSEMLRAEETLYQILKVLDLVGKVKEEKSNALNERDYGIYTGKNKWDMEKLVGEEKFLAIRRGWDTDIPEGENLKMVYDRAVPYFLNTILPHLLNGQNVLLVAHGNSIRSIMKYIENISDEGIGDVEMPFSTIYIYNLDKEGHMLNREVRSVE